MSPPSLPAWQTVLDAPLNGLGVYSKYLLICLCADAQAFKLESYTANKLGRRYGMPDKGTSTAIKELIRYGYLRDSIGQLKGRKLEPGSQLFQLAKPPSPETSQSENTEAIKKSKSRKKRGTKPTPLPAGQNHHAHMVVDLLNPLRIKKSDITPPRKQVTADASITAAKPLSSSEYIQPIASISPEYDPQILGTAILQHPLRIPTRILLCALLRHAEPWGVVRSLSNSQLQQLTGLTGDTLRYHMEILLRLGYLRSSIPGISADPPFDHAKGIHTLNLRHSNFGCLAAPGATLLFIPSDRRSIECESIQIKEAAYHIQRQLNKEEKSIDGETTYTMALACCPEGLNHRTYKIFIYPDENRLIDHLQALIDIHATLLLMDSNPKTLKAVKDVVMRENITSNIKNDLYGNRNVTDDVISHAEQEASTEKDTKKMKKKLEHVKDLKEIKITQDCVAKIISWCSYNKAFRINQVKKCLKLQGGSFGIITIPVKYANARDGGRRMTLEWFYQGAGKANCITYKWSLHPDLAPRDCMAILHAKPPVLDDFFYDETKMNEKMRSQHGLYTPI
ncbi:MAG TPA: hypothetical protein PK031_09785 [Pseudomonadales bacterium]|nr:hypothetical protein [Pseudomonadales bacterium]